MRHAHLSRKTRFIWGLLLMALTAWPGLALAWSSCSAAPNECNTGGEWCYTAGAGSCSNRCSADCPPGGNYTFTNSEFCPLKGDCGPLHRECQCQLQSTTNPDCSSLPGNLFMGDGENCNVKCRTYCGFLGGGCVQQDGEPRACMSDNRAVCACGRPND